jgi:DNA processing protein
VDETFDLLTLALLPKLGPACVRNLSRRGPLGNAVAHPHDHADLLPAEAVDELRTGTARRAAEAELGRARSLGIGIVGFGEADYPELLRETFDPPPVLYVRGALRGGEGERSVAIVGSRAASPQGRALARSMARDLGAWGATVVSGLARGIDSAAHRGALEGGGRTVAVLGSGLDRVYPEENAGLASAVAETGAVVSEFPLGTAPYRGNFPRRNRVIAGWGRAVVVVEAAQRSGALVTARLALDEGREVLAVPGHPSFGLAAGTNALIRDGARLTRDAADVAEELGLVRPVTAGSVVLADDVLQALRADVPSSLEEIQERSGRSAAELLARLTELELTDKVRRLPGTLFVRR